MEYYTIKVIIIDDDNDAIINLQKGLKSFSNIEVVETASNCEDGEKAILKFKPQLLFLDIEMPPLNGLDFYNNLRTRINWNMKVVFYTSYEKYMLQAFRLEAFDFLTKPFEKKELEVILNRYFTSLREQREDPVSPIIGMTNEKKLLLTTFNNDKIIIHPYNVGYFRYNSVRKYWEAILDDSRNFILKYSTTSDIILGYSEDFIQIHKTFIINIKHLCLIQENSCIMHYPFNTEKELKISKLYRKKLLDRFYDL